MSVTALSTCVWTAREVDPLLHAERLDRLVIINAPHPAVFRRELEQSPAQQEASRPIVENDRLLVRLAVSKVKQGVASKLDVAKQKTVLFADEVTLEKASQNIAIARANLANLLYTSQADLVTPAAPLVPIGSWPHSLEETIRASEAYRKVIEQRLLDVMVNEAQAKIYLMSGWSADIAEELFTIPLERASQAQRLLTEKATVILLPDAHRTLAVLK